MVINNFFELPNFVTSIIYTEWISLQDIARIDIAVCNKEQRKMFMHSLKDDYLLVDGLHGHNSTNANYLSWLATRQIKIKQLFIDSVYLSSLSESVYTIDTSRLLFLHLKNDFVAKNDNYKKLFIRSPLLQEVKFENMGNTFGSPIFNIGLFCPKLKTVDAQGCDIFSDLSMINIAQYCKDGLLKVNISCCNKVTNASIKALAEFCPNLEYLNISYCYSISPEAIDSLVGTCKELKELHCEDLVLSDEVVINVLQKCQKLEIFNCDFCKGLTPVSLQGVTSTGTKFKNFVTKDFALSQIAAGKSELKLKGYYTRQALILEIINNSPLIQMIDIHECQKIRDVNIFKNFRIIWRATRIYLGE